MSRTSDVDMDIFAVLEVEFGSESSRMCFFPPDARIGELDVVDSCATRYGVGRRGSGSSVASGELSRQDAGEVSLL